MIRETCEQSQHQMSTINLQERTININVFILFWSKREDIGIIAINTDFSESNVSMKDFTESSTNEKNII